MSNYVQITSFAPKDALNTGDPNKKIVGAHFDAEFGAIATAISSKFDANGSLNANQLTNTSAITVAESQITDGAILARVGGNETITGTWNFTTAPTISSGTVWHSGNDGASSTLDADLLDGQHGAYYRDASNLNAGTVADARLPAGLAKYGDSTANFTGTLQYGGLEVGYRHIPQASSQTGNYSTVLGDSGKHIIHPSGGGTGDTFTIDAAVSYPVGTAITFVNLDTNSLSIALSSGNMYISGSTSSGTRTLAQNGVATAFKADATTWLISGNGLA